MTAERLPVALRRAGQADAAQIAELFLASFAAALPDVASVHTDDQVRRWVQEVLVERQETWVAERARILGFMTLNGTELDHLYVAVHHWREGIGRLLLDLAKSLSPKLLELYTFQVNRGAVAFYLAQGFEIVGADDGLRNAEREPDFCLRWRPDSGNGVALVVDIVPVGLVLVTARLPPSATYNLALLLHSLARHRDIRLSAAEFWSKRTAHGAV